MGGKDRWPELCQFVSDDDGLPTRKVGAWTEDKLFFWHRYIEITTTAMVGHPKWQAGLVYVDLFGGPGVCEIETSGKRVPGSPLIAAYAPKPFERIIVCELDPQLGAACAKRLSRVGLSGRQKVISGDCNEKVSEVAADIPRGALTLAFIDPTGLHARFETVATLSERGRVDLLVLFADAYDIVRNVELYNDNPQSNLDQVLGPDSNWRPKWEALETRSSARVRKMFAGIYREQLRRHLGYKVFGEHTISGPKGALYRLIYASKHERGLEFWDKITKKDKGGQRHLDLQ